MLVTETESSYEVPFMNDSIPISQELSPQLNALREARQRAAEARANAERLLREAEAAEAELAAQEEQAIVAVAVQRERDALDTLSRLQAEVQQASAKKAQVEAAVAAIRASLAEHEEQLQNAEIHERALSSDLSIAERRVQDASRARELALSGISAAVPAGDPDTDTLPAPASLEGIRSQRAAERRMADALRAGSG